MRRRFSSQCFPPSPKQARLRHFASDFTSFPCTRRLALAILGTRRGELRGSREPPAHDQRSVWLPRLLSVQRSAIGEEEGDRAATWANRVAAAVCPSSRFARPAPRGVIGSLAHWLILSA